MVSGAEQVKEEFEKRHSRLKNAHSSLQQRIDQGTKLREGVSSPQMMSLISTRKCRDLHH